MKLELDGSLRCCALLEDVVVNRVHAPQRFRGDFGIWNADAERLFHADHELQRVDGIKAETPGTEKRQIITDLVGGGLEHQVLDQHLLDVLAQIGVGHGNDRSGVAGGADASRDFVAR